MRRHDEAGSSRPILKDDEPFEQFNKEFEEMQAMILKMINDTSVNRDQLLEMQGRLQRMKQGFMERSAAKKRQDDVDDDDVDDDDDDDAAHNDSTTEDDE
ncbi:hypothetical protein Sjap_026530 [Stephania japonica]|uniref:Uncharacterized protein n=1 Tax=Stephania japonica TaxID=461633 RepID=A0AAP0E3X3_9MAGN